MYIRYSYKARPVVKLTIPVPNMPCDSPISDATVSSLTDTYSSHGLLLQMHTCAMHARGPAADAHSGAGVQLQITIMSRHSTTIHTAYNNSFLT